MLKEIGKNGVMAAEQLKTVDTETKNQILDHMASELVKDCLLYTSPSPRDSRRSRMPSSA